MARRYASIPKSLKLWSRFVQVRIDVFYKALDMLNITDEMKAHEDNITEALYPKLEIACFEHEAKPEIPSWDAKIGAITDDELSQESIGKRPDFTCYIVDQTAENVEAHTIRLHIECKCIGIKRSPSWDLNMNYISNGINRFDLPTHEYGKRAQDGIMIGYIINSTKFDIQNEINNKLPKNIEKLNFKTESKVEKISTLFIREKVKPTDFTIHHIWADFS
jgi:hypothetical protein